MPLATGSTNAGSWECDKPMAPERLRGHRRRPPPRRGRLQLPGWPGTHGLLTEDYDLLDALAD